MKFGKTPTYVLLSLFSGLFIFSCATQQFPGQTSSAPKFERKLASGGSLYNGTLYSKNQSFNLEIWGGDEKTFVPTGSASAKPDNGDYDVVIVGGGLAGLAAGIYLSDNKQKVLLLEKEAHLGGLAAGGQTVNGISYDRGAAYFTKAYEEEYEILKHIGLSRYEKQFIIPEPIDTYLFNGTLYGGHPNEGLWDNSVLGTDKPKLEGSPILPASFAVFKFMLQKANEDELIPNQPFEEQKNLQLDGLDGAEWIRNMPEELEKVVAEEKSQQGQPQQQQQKHKAPSKHKQWLAKILQGKKAQHHAHHEPTAEEVYALFQKDIASGRVSKSDPMKDVIGLMDQYSRSALGATPDKISAVAFANFYISEIEPRYTSDIGTGKAALKMAAILNKRRGVTVKVLSPASKIINGKDGVEVHYINGGVTYSAKAKYGVFAAQLGIAPKLIQDFAKQSPAQAELMSELDYSHYSIHAVEVDGHPYREAYDTWVRPSKLNPNGFTDLIVGRWMEMHGYEKKGARNYAKNPDARGSVLSIYHPHATKWVGAYNDDRVAQIAESAVNEMQDVFQNEFKQEIKIKRVTTSRWPYSVHVAAPGHFTKKAKILRKPFGRIYFANNNLGTPAFEEALFRGHCAANNILFKVKPSFKQEAWSQCPREQ